MTRIILILVALFFTSCQNESLYRKRLYGGYLKCYKLNKRNKLVKKICTSNYIILERLVVDGKEYEILIHNDNFYNNLEECKKINSRAEYVKFMLKNHKKETPLILDSTCSKYLTTYIRHPEVCRDMDIDPYDYIDEYNMLGEGINDHDSIYCMIRKLLLSENLFIEYDGEYDYILVRKQPILEIY